MFPSNYGVISFQVIKMNDLKFTTAGEYMKDNMTKKVRVKISNGHKKSFVEVCTWSCKLSDILEQLDVEDEDQKLLKESLKLEGESEWLDMTEEVGWRWGEGSIVMTREEYDNYDWDNEEGELSFYDFEDAEFYESNDGCWTDLYFRNIHEDVEYDEDVLYDIMRDYGDVEECEITIYGPVEHEIEEEFEEEE